MTYLERIDATPEADRFALIRGWLDTEALPLVNELREKRPILQTPVCTFVADFNDVIEVLRVHQVFSVRPYHDKMQPYLMSQDDTEVHFRDKSAMSAFSTGPISLASGHWWRKKPISRWTRPRGRSTRCPA